LPGASARLFIGRPSPTVSPLAPPRAAPGGPKPCLAAWVLPDPLLPVRRPCRAVPVTRRAATPALAAPCAGSALPGGDDTHLRTRRASVTAASSDLIAR